MASVNYSRLYRKALAWSVHIFTASGAVWGLLSIMAIYQHNWKAVFIWIAIAVLVDGVDGALARRFRVKDYAAELDGALLDNLIDYLNYVIVPTLFLIEADMLPANLVMPTAVVIVLSSAYQFCQVDAKTHDHFFKGFPSYWNVLALYLFVLGWSQWVNFAIIIFCGILVFVPVKYIYPSRTQRGQNLTVILSYIWGAAGFAALMQYPNVPMWVVWCSVLYVVYYLVNSLPRNSDSTPSMNYIQWLRSLVGKRKIILVFSSVVLRDDRGRILLQRRTDFDVWGLPGGILEPGESILDCAQRELFEETGLTAGPLRLVGVYTDPKYDSIYPNGDQVQQCTICFEGKVNGGKMQVDGVETSDLAFFEPQDIPFGDLPIFYAHMLQHALAESQPSFEPPFTLPETIDQIVSIRQDIGHALCIAAGAMAVIQRSDGRILMTLRTDDGEWSMPGGYMAMGENIAYTAAREVHEEIGLEIVPERIMGIFSPTAPWLYPNGDQTQSVVVVFQARQVGGALQADHTEVSRVAWMTAQEILALETPALLMALNQAVIENVPNGAFILS